MSSDQRPTSPHLTVYKPQITSILSILHRLTGVALYVGTALMVYWLLVMAYYPANYSDLRDCLTSWFGRVVMIGWTLAFYYHLGNGIRHLFWDIGKGYSLPHVSRSGWLALMFAVAMTALTWISLLSAEQ